MKRIVVTSTVVLQDSETSSMGRSRVVGSAVDDGVKSVIAEQIKLGVLTPENVLKVTTHVSVTFPDRCPEREGDGNGAQCEKEDGYEPADAHACPTALAALDGRRQ